MDKLKVRNEASLVRDRSSKAILNTNNKGLETYKAQRAAMEKMKSAVDRIPHLESDIAQIKQMLEQLLNKG